MCELRLVQLTSGVRGASLDRERSKQARVAYVASWKGPSALPLSSWSPQLNRSPFIFFCWKETFYVSTSDYKDLCFMLITIGINEPLVRSYIIFLISGRESRVVNWFPITKNKPNWVWRCVSIKLLWMLRKEDFKFKPSRGNLET